MSKATVRTHRYEGRFNLLNPRETAVKYALDVRGIGGLDPIYVDMVVDIGSEYDCDCEDDPRELIEQIRQYHKSLWICSDRDEVIAKLDTLETNAHLWMPVWFKSQFDKASAEAAKHAAKARFWRDELDDFRDSLREKTVAA